MSLLPPVLLRLTSSQFSYLNASSAEIFFLLTLVKVISPQFSVIILVYFHNIICCDMCLLFLFSQNWKLHELLLCMFVCIIWNQHSIMLSKYLPHDYYSPMHSAYLLDVYYMPELFSLWRGCNGEWYRQGLALWSLHSNEEGRYQQIEK